MKKRFLPFSLLLVIMILGQSVMAGQVGHYVPRAKENSTAEAFINSMRVNQHTGLIDPAWMIAATKQATSNTRDYADVVYWKSMGPDNMGGRTTSIVYNNANRNEVYIGSMGGGVFYTWNLGISWHQVGDNLMVSCMAQAEDGTIYVGTGDGGSAATYNGLGDMSYDNSFIGSGLYTIKNNKMSVLASTVPSIQNGVAEWSFINEIAIDGDKIIVATSDGIRYSSDGNTWKYAKVGEDNLTGNAIEVKVGSDHTIVASVDGEIYIGKLDNMVRHSADSEVADSTGTITAIAAAAGLMDVAIAPSDPNVIYAANIGTSGDHVKIYATEDKGQTWRVILPAIAATGTYWVYEAMGLYNHGLVVAPDDPDCVYVLGYNLWRLKRPTTQPQGYYMGLKLSNASNLHVGINDFAFDPRNAKKAYVATDGGIYKAQAEAEYFSFVNCNRGYISTRCLNIAVSGKNTRVLAGVLDQGPILIEGMEGTNNMETGTLLLPTVTPAFYGSFSAADNAGPCAVSAILPNAFFLTTVDGGIQRTETAGEDYDFSNFTFDTDDTHPFAHTFSFTGYRMPMALWESFDDPNSVDEVMFQCKKDQYAGDVVQCFSHNGDYPFDFTLPCDMHYNDTMPVLSDSLMVHDPITSKLYVVADKDGGYAVYFTNQPLLFNSTTEWFALATFENYPTCISVSGDGDVLFVGTANGKIERLSNLNTVVDTYTAHPDSAGFAVEFAEIDLQVEQVVTSVGIYTDNSNKVVATLGNYGNDAYVMYSDNALSANPSFVAKQGEGLPKMPVYSCVYTSTYDGADEGHVLIGTEHGIYRTTDIAASSPVWVAEKDNMGDVPVLDLKQQIMHHDAQNIYVTIDSVTTVTTYPGINNEGIIYAATYGRGLFRCETYRQNSGTSVPETPAVAIKSNVSMYPNPVRDEAKVCFELNDVTEVSYQVFDMSGRMVQTQCLGRFAEGKHEVNVMMSDLSKGAYLLRLNAGSRTSTVKFMVF